MIVKMTRSGWLPVFEAVACLSADAGDAGAPGASGALGRVPARQAHPLTSGAAAARDLKQSRETYVIYGKQSPFHECITDSLLMVLPPRDPV